MLGSLFASPAPASEFAPTAPERSLEEGNQGRAATTPGDPRAPELLQALSAVRPRADESTAVAVIASLPIASGTVVEKTPPVSGTARPFTEKLAIGECAGHVAVVAAVPIASDVMVTTGGVVSTVTLTLALALPPVFVAVAVIVHGPSAERCRPRRANDCGGAVHADGGACGGRSATDTGELESSAPFAGELTAIVGGGIEPLFGDHLHPEGEVRVLGRHAHRVHPRSAREREAPDAQNAGGAARADGLRRRTDGLGVQDQLVDEVSWITPVGS